MLKTGGFKQMDKNNLALWIIVGGVILMLIVLGVGFYLQFFN